MQQNELIKGCTKNISAYQEQLFREFYVSVSLLCLRYSKNEEEAESALLNGFVEIFKTIKTYKATKSFDEWIKQTVLKSVIKNLRSGKQNYMIASTVNAKTIKHTNSESTATNTLPISKELLLTALQSLSPSLRTIYNLTVIEKFSFAEIGVMLDMSESTAKLNSSKALFSFNETVSVLIKKRLDEEELKAMDEEVRRAITRVDITYKPELWTKMKEKLLEAAKPNESEKKNWGAILLVTVILILIVIIMIQIKNENNPRPKEVQPTITVPLNADSLEEYVVDSMRKLFPTVTQGVNEKAVREDENLFPKANPQKRYYRTDTTKRGNKDSVRAKQNGTSSEEKVKAKGFEMLPTNLHPDSIRKHREQSSKDTLK